MKNAGRATRGGLARGETKYKSICDKLELQAPTQLESQSFKLSEGENSSKPEANSLSLKLEVRSSKIQASRESFIKKEKNNINTLHIKSAVDIWPERIHNSQVQNSKFEHFSQRIELIDVNHDYNLPILGISASIVFEGVWD